MYFKYNSIVVYLVILFSLNYNGHSKPMEVHIPGYHYCGPGTKYLERISKGQYGVNKLDQACRSHDLAYTKPDLEPRILADKKLEIQAWDRVKAHDSGYKEKIAAWMVTNFMKIQQKWNHSRLRRDVTGKIRHDEMYPIKSNMRNSYENRTPLLQIIIRR